MDSGVYVLLGLIASLVGLRSVIRGKERPSWQKAAAELGLRCSGGAIRGSIGNFAVTIDSSGADRGTRIVIRGGDIPSDLSLHQEDIANRLGKALGGQDLQTGDRAFDAQVRVRGDELVATALLDAALRSEVRREIQGGTWVERGQVFSVAGEIVDDPYRLVAWTKALVELGAKLAVGSVEIPERLAKNALTDWNESVQLRNLTLLQEHYSGTGVALETSRTLARSSDPVVRLQAARHLGEEGFEVVRSLAEDEGMDARIRCAGLQHLVQSGGEPAAAALERALSSTDLLVLDTAIEGIGRLRHRAAVPRLLALMQAAGESSQLAIAKALERIGDPAAEPGLLPWLQCERAPVRIAVAETLSRIGTVLAVQPLLACTTGLLADPTLKRAARVAIDSIQSRLGDVDAGRLSLSGLSHEQGSLSLAGEEGKLSLPDAKTEAEGGRSRADLPQDAP